jgi:hypothetical protein
MDIEKPYWECFVKVCMYVYVLSLNQNILNSNTLETPNTISEEARHFIIYKVKYFEHTNNGSSLLCIWCLQGITIKNVLVE